MSLGELPENAGKTERLVAEDLRLLFGLRLADGDRETLIYSCRFCAARLGLGPNGHVLASRALRRLDAWGVIRSPGTFRLRNGWKAKLYAPPLPAQRAPLVVEGDRPAVVPDAAALDPAVELADDAVVDGADAGVADDPGVVAARDSAAPGAGAAAGEFEWDLDDVIARHVHDTNVTAERGTCRRHTGREWRRGEGRPWTCAICHPPAVEDVEWREPAGVTA